MSRNASGTYTLPAGNPVVTGTTIAATWANNTLSDISTELSDSLSRSGKGGMTAALRGVDGAVANPAVSFTADPDTGIWRPADNRVEISTGGTSGVRFGTDATMLFGTAERLKFDASGVKINGADYLSGQPTFRNRIINGGFDIWQRGTSQTSSDYGSDDRWASTHTGSTKTASRQSFTVGQTDVPGNPLYFARTVVSSVAGSENGVVKRQRIEGVRTFAGQSVTLSFYAKADASKSIAVEFAQVFGTGGSPSSPVTGIGAQKFNLTTSWQKFTATVLIPSISGKTIGTAGDNHLEFLFWFDAGSGYNSRTASLGQQSGTFDIALVQVEAGSVATPFEFRPPQVELALCQRYFCTIAGKSDVGQVVQRTSTSGNYGGAVGYFSYPVQMRTAPTMTLYTNLSRANAGNVLVNATTPSSSFSSAVGTDGFVIFNNTALATVGDYFAFFYDASAEF